RGAAAPRAGSHSGFGGHVTEGAVTVVAKKLIAAVAGDIDVQVAVVIVVADGHAGREHSIAFEACFSGYVLEFSGAEIAIKHIAWRWLAVGQIGSVGEIQVGQAVVIEIDHAHAGAESFEHVLIRRRAAFMAKGNARFRRDVIKLYRFGGLLAMERQGREKHQQIRAEDQESFQGLGWASIHACSREALAVSPSAVNDRARIP